ncbi:MAG: diguanylate cyclase [Candidatus Devosia phytovorans]|uniref:diguanylate cyclase n=1 Tax=Candidatus Devosia phytovorans TaxID=3121372 RepID=A0AAJ5VUQ6_9HYPH|nr:diguanylate cyclase [Devosia sp.]WEK04486.1 MAG: diguanylate cyclase [Devosia sp.]
MLVQDTIIALIHGVGLLALMAIAFGQVERQQHWARGFRSFIHGLIFGSGAIVAMLAPARIGDGIIVDSRALIVAFAAAFGGWPAALVAVAISASFRLWLGGIGATPGAVGIAAAAALGLGWRHYLRPKTRIKPRHLVVLGLVVSCYLLPSMAMGYSTISTVIGIIGPYMVAASVFASVLLGLFVDRELNQIEREQQWKMRALTDPLTALPNRRAFERGIDNLRLDKDQAALLIIDLDHFKLVNDTHGHAAGDYVLQQVSLILRANMRNGDLLSRLGGEELAVLLPDTGTVDAKLIAERLRQAIEALNIHWENQTISITASFGVVVGLGTLASAEMFARADAALYAAKNTGRNRVVFSGEMLAPGDGTAVMPLAPGRAA